MAKMSGYPIRIITSYRAGKITRQQFCNAWAKLQGFDDTVKGYGNKYGTFITYRGRTARITNGLLVWGENHKTHTAKTIKEMKIKVDYYEQEAL
jgi:hypothetical protein